MDYATAKVQILAFMRSTTDQVFCGRGDRLGKDSSKKATRINVQNIHRTHIIKQNRTIGKLFTQASMDVETSWLLNTQKIFNFTSSQKQAKQNNKIIFYPLQWKIQKVVVSTDDDIRKKESSSTSCNNSEAVWRNLQLTCVHSASQQTHFCYIIQRMSCTGPQGTMCEHHCS